MSHRILHVIRSVGATGGGPVEAIKLLASVHQRLGHDSEVVALDDPNDAAVQSFPFRCHAMVPSLTGYGYSSRLVPWLRANRSRYDVIFVHGLWQYGSFGVWRALHGTRTPYFVFPHGMLDPWFKRTYPLKHLKKWLYWPWAEYQVLRDARGVLFTCEEERRLARESFWLYRARERVVNCGTSPRSGDPAAQRAAFLARFPELTNRRCLLFLGRVHVKKGPDLLLRALREILTNRKRAETDAVQLVMAGPNDHDYGRAMVELARELGLADRVTWTGMLTGDLKWGAFHTAEAFVLPSHQENFGIAVAEALACGVPVLISNRVNIWREIEQDAGGLVEADDLAGTLRLLERWLATDRQAWSAMRRNALACFERRFNIEQTAEDLIRLFEASVEETL